MVGSMLAPCSHAAYAQFPGTNQHNMEASGWNRSIRNTDDQNADTMITESQRNDSYYISKDASTAEPA
jgi:hypothetical protein